MKFTNKKNHSAVLVEAVMADEYTKGEAQVTVTGLLGPPRARILSITRDKDIIVDIDSLLASLYGQVMHGILERAGKECLRKGIITQAIYEKRWYHTIDGVKVGGQCDAVYAGGTLVDYKFVSYWSVIFEKKEYEKQLNCYAYILGQNGIKVDKLVINYVFRDWTETVAAKGAKFPQSRSMEVEVKLWSEEEQLQFIKDRIVLHRQAMVELPECSKEERWERQGISKKCQSGYCPAASVCDQWKTEQEKTKNTLGKKKKPVFRVRKNSDKTNKKDKQ